MRVDMYTERYYEFEEPYNGATVTVVLKNNVPLMYQYEYKDVQNTLAYKFRALYNLKYIGDIVNVWNEKRLLKKLDEVESGIVISAMIVISVLMVLKPITWVVLGLGALLTIMIAIGIYLFEKHYLN